VWSADVEEPDRWERATAEAPIWMLGSPASPDSRWREIEPVELPTTNIDEDALPPLLVVLEDGEGRRWFRRSPRSLRATLTYQRLASSPHDAELAAEPYGDQVEVLVDNRGTAWLGSYNSGLERWSGRAVVAFDELEALPRRIRALVMDREGGLWLGSYSEGLFHLSEPLVATLSARQGLPSDNVRSLLEDSNRDLWIATWGGGLARLRKTNTEDGHHLRVFTRADGLPSDEVWALHEAPKGAPNGDDGGDLWVGTAAGLARRVGERFESLSRLGNDPMPGIRTITTDASGTLWAGGQDGLVRRRDGSLAERQPV
jgi:ligand-binding sensor domain-containing protein